MPAAAGTSVLHTQYGAFLQAGAAPMAMAEAADTFLPGGEHGLFLVQSLGGRSANVRTALLGLGVAVHGYFPDDAWSVSASAAQVRAIATLDDVQAVAPLPVSLKLQPAMVTATQRGLMLADASAVADLWVEMTQAQDADVIAAAVAAWEGKVVSGDAGLQVMRVTLPRTAVTLLAQMPEVLAIEPYTAPQMTNDLSYGIVQSGRRNEAPLWAHGLRGQGQVVGMSDSGVDTDSCYFSGGKVKGYIEFTGLHDGDGTGHGTHVAGSIAGNAAGDDQAHPHGGMAPGARLFVEDVGAGSDLVGIPGDLSALFAPAYAAGARIHSNSWVGGSGKYGVMSRALDRFVAAHPDFVPLFAAGNAGRRGAGTVLEPAVAKNVIAVGAVDGAHPGDIVDFSSHGTTRDGRIKPAIVAPGVGVVSASAGAACGTRTLSGTSMATPTAAGSLALARQYYVEGYYPSGNPNAEDAHNPSAALLRATLIAGAVDTSSPGQGLAASFGGFGRMQLDNTMVFDARANHLWLRDESQGLTDNQSMTFTLHVANGDNPVRVALVWTDPPASAGAGNALVNDLDLEIAGPDGVVYRGNAMQDGVSTADGARDGSNVEEVVSLPRLPAGDLQVTVRAHRIPVGPQGFAVVAVGDFAP